MSRLITTAMALVSALICCPRITAPARYWISKRSFALGLAQPISAFTSKGFSSHNRSGPIRIK
jgi:hypothetical protein